MFLAASLLLLLSAPQPGSSGLMGEWKTSDNSILKVYSCDQTRLCVRIVAIGPKNEPSVDVNNPVRSDRSRALCGLQIGSGFTPDGPDHAHNGHIYDPKSGKTYSSDMTVDGEKLKLRGYVGISMFGRTETWHRTQEPPTCG